MKKTFCRILLTPVWIGLVFIWLIFQVPVKTLEYLLDLIEKTEKNC